MKNKNNLIYILLAVFAVITVVAKQMLITAKRNKEVVSLVSEWDALGKPVVTETASRKDIKLYTKISLTRSSGHIYESDVPKSIREKIIPGQAVYLIKDKNKEAGKIIEVQKNINSDTGMFRIKVSMDRLNGEEERTVVACIHTGTFKGVISIPNEILDREKGKDYIWIANGDKAVRRIVGIDERNGYGAIVSKGLKEGEAIIVKGFTILRENDKLKVLNGASIEGGRS